MGKKTGFFCFSPPIMIATFVIEISYVLYIVFRYKMGTLTRLAVSLLFLLAMFQLSEYFVCSGSSQNAMAWSRVGFVSVTFLPAIGIHFLYSIAQKPRNRIIDSAYGMAIAWTAVFAFSERAFAGHVCAGNYVIFQVKPVLSELYFLYYYFWLFVGTYLCIKLAKSINSVKTKESLALLGLGYLSFLIPTTLANIAKPETLQGIPSIMCGFAIILASIVTFAIMPRVSEQKEFGFFSRC